jgi:Tol biopolymer transport system component
LASTRAGYWADFYRLRPDGLDLERLTALAGERDFRTWSPDGQWLYFAYVPAGEQSSDLYRVRLDGGQLERVTHHIGYPVHLAWSPDGQWLVFIARNGQPGGGRVGQLYKMRADGRDLQLLARAVWQQPLRWTPDHEALIYAAYRPPEIYSALYQVSLDGGQERLIARTVPMSTLAAYGTTTLEPDRVVGWIAPLDLPWRAARLALVGAALLIGGAGWGWRRLARQGR